MDPIGGRGQYMLDGDGLAPIPRIGPWDIGVGIGRRRRGGSVRDRGGVGRGAGVSRIATGSQGRRRCRGINAIGRGRSQPGSDGGSKGRSGIGGAGAAQQVRA